jgi:putative ABC transport system permease protein
MVLTVVLLIGAGLMVSGVQRLAEPGRDIHPERSLTLRIDLPESRYPLPQQRAHIQEELLNAFASLPGAGSVAFGNWLPYAMSSGAMPFTVEEQPPARPGTEPTAQMQVVGGAYFQNLNIRLERGRLFDDRDGAGAPPVAIVSEHLARRFFPGQDPLGKHLRADLRTTPGKPATIVGVVADIRLDPWDHAIDPVIYRPFRQSPKGAAQFLVRTSGDPQALIPAAREQVARIAPNQPVRDIMTYAKVIDDSLVGLRYVASMMAVFGVIGLLLSAAGIYGVMAYSVSERRHEIGVRMTLGARSTDIVWMLGRWGLTLTGVGLGIGVPAAFGLASLLANLLFGVGAYDPVSFAGGVLVLCAAVMFACYVPVRRALAVDPIMTLRTG